ncbi:MAG: helix-turn-helix domain-containing protein [Reyranellaceae bacterium]
MLTPRTLSRLCRARDELRETLASPRSIHDVAQAARMSPYHFIRRFEAVFGETPHQFRTWVRLERAKHLLALSDYSVTDVCMEIGFTSLGSFSNLFTQRIGVAPSLYRRQIRSSIQIPGNPAEVLFPGCLMLMSRLPPLRTFREVPESPQD